MTREHYAYISGKRWELAEYLIEKYSANIIPLYPFDWKKDESKAGKIPCIRWKGRESATFEELNDWKERGYYRNIGLILGGKSGFVAIDVDGEDGKKLLRQMRGGNRMPITVTYTTPGGGIRYLFRVRKKDREKKFRKYYLPSEIEEHGECALLGDGQQTVLPYSIHPNGGIYEFKEGKSFDDVKVAFVPNWMKELMLNPSRTKRTSTRVGRKSARREKTDYNNPGNPEFDMLFSRCSRLMDMYEEQRTSGLCEEDWFRVVSFLTQLGPLSCFAMPFSELSYKHDDYSVNRINELLEENKYANKGTIRCTTFCCDKNQIGECYEKINYNAEREITNSPAKNIKDAVNSNKGFTDISTGIRYNHYGIFSGVEPNQFIKFFLEENHIRFREAENGQKENDRYYRYCEDNYWEYISERGVKQLLKDFLDGYVKNKWRINIRTECMEVLNLTCPNAGKSDDNYINIKNGLLDISKYPFKLKPHTKDIFTTIQIPVEFYPNSEQEDDPPCPNFMQFIKDVCKNKKQLRYILQEIMGYSFSNTTKAGKCFFFIGPSDTGKSTLGQIIMELAGGPKNVSSLSLQEFGKGFALADLVDKNLNIAFENKNLKQEDIQTFKAVVTGDVTRVEKKYANGISYLHKAKLIFCMNEMPEIEDSSGAIIKRILPVPFEQKFVDGTPTNKNEKSKNRDLKEKLIKDELDGIFAFAMRGLERLIKNRYEFTKSANVDRLLTTYEHEVNPFLQFINECVGVVTDDQEHDRFRVHMNAMYYAFKMWDSEQGNFQDLRTTDKNLIKSEKTKILRNIRKTLDDKSIQYVYKDSNGPKYFYGIKLTAKGRVLVKNCQHPAAKEVASMKRAGVNI